MLLMTLPPLAGKLLSLLIGAVYVLSAVRSNRPSVTDRLPEADDTEHRIQAFTKRVRRRVRLSHWFRG